jgi:hypothetical protein
MNYSQKAAEVITSDWLRGRDMGYRAGYERALVDAEQAITEYKWTGVGNSYLGELVLVIRALAAAPALSGGKTK